MIVKVTVLTHFKEHLIKEMNRHPPSKVEVNWYDNTFIIHKVLEVQHDDTLAMRCIRLYYQNNNKVVHIEIPAEAWIGLHITENWQNESK